MMFYKKIIGGNNMVKNYIHKVKAIKYTGENKSMIKEFLGRVKQSLWN